MSRLVDPLAGCGLEHPDDWEPTVSLIVNGVEVGGDDYADAMAHYMLQCGYPRDQPAHLRDVAERVAARRGRCRQSVGGSVPIAWWIAPTAA